MKKNISPQGILDVIAGLSPGTTFSMLFDRQTYLVLIDDLERRYPVVLQAQASTPALAA